MIVAYSVTFHESFDCFLDQVLNFDFFTSNAILVIHVNAKSEHLFKFISAFDFNKLGLKSLRVILNPERFNTSKDLFCLHKAHISNFNLLKNLGFHFDYFCLESSNSLFIKKGVESHIVKFDAGLNKSTYDSLWGPRFLSHKTIIDFLNAKDINDFSAHNVKSMHEGMFFCSELADDVIKIVSELDEFCNFNSDPPNYPTEEFWFSLAYFLIANSSDYKSTGTITYMPWHRGLSWSLFDIDNAIRDIEFPRNKFLIKRVERRFDDNVRVFIRDFFGY